MSADVIQRVKVMAKNGEYGGLVFGHKENVETHEEPVPDDDVESSDSDSELDNDEGSDDDDDRHDF